MTFINYSYQKHAENFAKDLTDKKRISISESWFNEDTADYWRHARQYECADCVLPENPGVSWLTIGDGRWGLDSIRIKKKGFNNVLPTDISEPLLKAAKDRGYISEYMVENCERLSFADEQFDYVFCKESLHHFPRPYLALYEMLRVAKQAVFCIEPNDPVGTTPPRGSAITLTFRSALRYTMQLFIMRLRQKAARLELTTYKDNKNIFQFFYNDPAWETVGNYVYGLSRREYEKIAYGLNLPQIIFKGLNDHYIEGCEFEPADMEKSRIFKTIVETIENADKSCEAGMGDYAMLMCGIFKKPMSTQVRENFINKKWVVKDLKRNPYVT